MDGDDSAEVVPAEPTSVDLGDPRSLDDRAEAWLRMSEGVAEGYRRGTGMKAFLLAAMGLVMIILVLANITDLITFFGTS